MWPYSPLISIGLSFYLDHLSKKLLGPYLSQELTEDSIDIELFNKDGKVELRDLKLNVEKLNELLPKREIDRDRDGNGNGNRNRNRNRDGVADGDKVRSFLEIALATMKEDTSFFTPRSSVTVFKVTGIVAALDEVEKANRATFLIFLKKINGFKFAKILSIKEYVKVK